MTLTADEKVRLFNAQGNIGTSCHWETYPDNNEACGVVVGPAVVIHEHNLEIAVVPVTEVNNKILAIALDSIWY